MQNLSISIVICSKDARQARWVKRNLLRTAAHPDCLEILVLDNTVHPRGICAVYNEGVARSHGELLVFMHEDVYMMEAGWDTAQQALFAGNPRMGVLGVAGSSWLAADPPLWSKAGPPWTFGKVVHELDGGREYFLTLLNETDGDREVAVLDGLWMAVRRSVLNTCAFDAQNFPGFHFYDADFCLQAGLCWEIWATTRIRVKHRSAGNFGAAWKKAAETFQEKWQGQLPLRKGFDSDLPPGSRKIASFDLRGKTPQLTLV